MAEGKAALTDSKVERMRKTLEPMPRLCAKVVHGFGRGSKLLGFPTANMKIRWDVVESPEKLEPQEKDVLDFARSCEAGIYYGWAQVSNGSDRGIYKTAMSVGWNPTFPDVKAKTMEPWILHDYADDFYDCELRLIICGFVRPEAKFADFKDLIVAIREDGEFCRETLDDEALAALAKDPFFIAKDAEVA
ncbi:unnamed protein product [Cladocopium goreaui]|uniref:riboflavin kinase n=1 Tax=Cladocopium goreaui TaxID=2562237 RepID=A0A9P1DPF3_9DINO|nr:unnamed protein product [Cladocopium goreaui]